MNESMDGWMNEGTNERMNISERWKEQTNTEKQNPQQANKHTCNRRSIVILLRKAIAKNE